MTTLLEVAGITKRFGGLTAVSEVSFSVKKGEIFGIIGPNGAGKTTLFNVIAGFFSPSAGRVTFDGRDITGCSSDEVGRLGMARTFQSVHLFRELTVAENLRRAEVISRCHSPLAYCSPRRREGSGDLRSISEFIGLSSVHHQVAGGLGYGLQKLLGIGMAMINSPKLVLMDEPAAGLNPSEKQEAGTLIRRMRDERGTSIVLVEHDMSLVMSICDRILVVNQGKPIALGTPSAVKADSAVIDAYLGEEYEFA
jgi:branched-chain amino acid transport system ATP-binding protein